MDEIEPRIQENERCTSDATLGPIGEDKIHQSRWKSWKIVHSNYQPQHSRCIVHTFRLFFVSLFLFISWLTPVDEVSLTHCNALLCIAWTRGCLRRNTVGQVWPRTPVLLWDSYQLDVEVENEKVTNEARRCWESNHLIGRSVEHTLIQVARDYSPGKTK